MVKRLGLGLLKGLIIGGLIGAGLQYGLGWTTALGLLGFLVAMGAAGTAGVFAGKPPWMEGAWIEASLKGMVGVCLGALAYWGLTYLKFEVPYPGLPGTHQLGALPAVFAPAIAGVYGALVELDNSGDEGKSSGPKARVELSDASTEEATVSSGRSAKKKRRS